MGKRSGGQSLRTLSVLCTEKVTWDEYLGNVGVFFGAPIHPVWREGPGQEGVYANTSATTSERPLCHIAPQPFHFLVRLLERPPPPRV